MVTVSHVAVVQAIADALQREAAIDADNIVVNCDGDDVWLSGHVQSWAAYLHAEAATRATPGVHSVHNDIRLRMPPLWSAPNPTPSRGEVTPPGQHEALETRCTPK
jgi:hypothetical protein